MRNLSATLLAATLLCTIISTPAGLGHNVAAEEGSRPELFIQVDGELLTIKAIAITQRQLLEELAATLGFELVLEGPLDEPRTLELQGKPWEEVMKRAVSPASWAYVYEYSAAGARLAKVFVIPLQANDTSPFTVPAASAEEPLPPFPVPAQEVPGQGTPFIPDEQEGINAALTTLVEDDDEEKRAIALIGVAAMGEQAVNGLVQAIQQEDAPTREMALEGLTQMGGEEAIRELQQALQDEDEDLQQAAQEALGKLLQGSK